MPIKVPFTPNPNLSPPFSFYITLDGKLYNLTVTWSIGGQRWYLNCYDSSQNHIFSLPKVGSPSGMQFESLESDDEGNVTAVSSNPHGLDVGSVVQLQVYGCVPVAFNGSFPCSVLDGETFTWEIPNTTTNPGTVSTLGWFKQMLNLLGGYFDMNSMEYWTDGQAFVIYP